MQLIFSLLSFTFVIFYLFLSIFALYRGWRNRANQIFAVFSLLLAAWALGYTFIFSAADKSEVLIWYRFSAFGWNLASAAGFHLWFVITRKHPRKYHLVLPLVFYAPGVLFLVQSLKGVLFAYDFTPSWYGWQEMVDPKNPWIIAYSLFQLAFASTGIVILLRWLRQNRNSVKIRRQTTIMITTILVSTFLTFGSNYFASAYRWNIPPLGHIFFGVWAFGIWISIIKYKLMNLTPEIVADEITLKMMDILVLVDSQGKIIKMNPRAEEILGYSQSEAVGKAFSPMVHEKDLFFRLILKIREEYIPVTNEIHLCTKKSELIPVSMYASLVKDSLGDNAGFMIMAHDIRDMKTLQNEIARRKKAQEELKATYAELENEKNKLKIRNEIYEHELSLARAIQMQFIPKTSPSTDIAFYYHPMEEVGGDFFDIVRYSNGNTGIFVSDVSGHGVPAALITSMIKSITLQFSPVLDDPAEMLYLMNDFLFGFTGGNFITAFYGIYDPSDRSFHFANAGHLPPLLIRKNKVTQIGADKKGVPLGILSNNEIRSSEKKYHNHKTILPGGSKLYLYTDGLSETVSIIDKLADAEDFGTRFLYSVLEELYSLPAPVFIDRLMQRLMEFRGSDRFEDDICMICMDIREDTKLLKKKAKD